MNLFDRIKYYAYMKLNITEVIATVVTGTIIPFILPITPFLYVTFGMIFADLYTGVRAARHKKEKITSRGFSRTVEKIMVYCSVILMSEGLVKAFSLPIPVTYMSALAICLTEFKSILENTYVITGVDLLKKLKSIFNEETSGKGNQ